MEGSNDLGGDIRKSSEKVSLLLRFCPLKGPRFVVIWSTQGSDGKRFVLLVKYHGKTFFKEKYKGSISPERVFGIICLFLQKKLHYFKPACICSLTELFDLLGVNICTLHESLDGSSRFPSSFADVFFSSLCP